MPETASPPAVPEAPQVVKVGFDDYLARVRVVLDGEPQVLTDGLTLAELVVHLGLTQRRIAIEVNHEIVARDRFEAHRLAAGDEVEIVHFVGGG